MRFEGETARKGIEWVHRVPVYRFRGQLLPLVDLNRKLGLPDRSPDDAVNIVVVRADERSFGFVVDRILDIAQATVELGAPGRRARLRGEGQPEFGLLAEIARSHHERWDGTGYPDRLSKTEIPLSARVVGILSVYEALRCRRPHRPAIGHASATRLIVSESPGEFDPVLVTAFESASTNIANIHSSIRDETSSF